MFARLLLTYSVIRLQKLAYLRVQILIMLILPHVSALKSVLRFQLCFPRTLPKPVFLNVLTIATLIITREDASLFVPLLLCKLLLMIQPIDVFQLVQPSLITSLLIKLGNAFNSVLLLQQCGQIIRQENVWKIVQEELLILMLITQLVSV
jgi:hypothetical protein